MVNKAVLNRPNEIFTEREEQRKEIDARKTSGEKLKGFPKPFNQVADKAFHITFLHSFDKALPIKTHKVWVEAANNRRGYYKLVVCKKQYSAIDPIYEHCEICETKIAGKKQLPFDMYAFVGYVHNFEGEVFTPDESKPEVFYNINPVRLVQVRFGKGAGTINTLKEDVRAGLFNKVMYEQKRTGAGKETVYHPLTKVSKEWLGPNAKTEVPKHILEEYASKTEDDIAREILVNFEGVLWDLWEVEPPVADTGEKVTEPTHTDVEPEAPARAAVKGAAKKALG